MCRNLFDLFHTEKQLTTQADKADGHAEKLIECEKDVKAVIKAVDKQSKLKAERQKEWAAIDKNVEDLEKQIKRIQHKDVFKFDSELKSRKLELDGIDRDLENAKKKLKNTQDMAEEDQRHYDELSRSLKEEEERLESRDIKLGAEQVTRYSALHQMAKVKNFKTQENIDTARLLHQSEERELAKEEGELSRLVSKRKAAITKSEDSKALKDKHEAKYQARPLFPVVYCTCLLTSAVVDVRK